MITFHVIRGDTESSYWIWDTGSSWGHFLSCQCYFRLTWKLRHWLLRAGHKVFQDDEEIRQFRGGFFVSQFLYSCISLIHSCCHLPRWLDAASLSGFVCFPQFCYFPISPSCWLLLFCYWWQFDLAFYLLTIFYQMKKKDAWWWISSAK